MSDEYLDTPETFRNRLSMTDLFLGLLFLAAMLAAAWVLEAWPHRNTFRVALAVCLAAAATIPALIWRRRSQERASLSEDGLIVNGTTVSLEQIDRVEEVPGGLAIWRVGRLRPLWLPGNERLNSALKQRLIERPIWFSFWTPYNRVLGIWILELLVLSLALGLLAVPHLAIQWEMGDVLAAGPSSRFAPLHRSLTQQKTFPQPSGALERFALGPLTLEIDLKDLLMAELDWALVNTILSYRDGSSVVLRLEGPRVPELRRALPSWLEAIGGPFYPWPSSTADRDLYPSLYSRSPAEYRLTLGPATVFGLLFSLREKRQQPVDEQGYRPFKTENMAGLRFRSDSSSPELAGQEWVRFWMGHRSVLMILRPGQGNDRFPPERAQGLIASAQPRFTLSVAQLEELFLDAKRTLEKGDTPRALLLIVSMMRHGFPVRPARWLDHCQVMIEGMKREPRAYKMHADRVRERLALLPDSPRKQSMKVELQRVLEDGTR